MKESKLYKNKSNKMIVVLMLLSFLVIFSSVFAYMVHMVFGIIVLFIGIINLNLTIKTLTVRRLNKKMLEGKNCHRNDFVFDGIEELIKVIKKREYKQDVLDISFDEYYKFDKTDYKKITIVNDLYRYQAYCGIIQDDDLKLEFEKNPLYKNPKKKKEIDKANRMVQITFLKDSDEARNLSLRLSFSLAHVCFAFFCYADKKIIALSYKGMDAEIKELYNSILQDLEIKNESV